MLIFASLLWIVVCAVDAASVRSQAKESSVQSTPLSESRVLTRRLNIFESFAKSDDERQGHLQLPVAIVEHHQDCEGSNDDQTVNEILQDPRMALVEVIEGIRNPAVSSEPIESLIVFQSLLKMLSARNPKECDSPLPWQQYLSESIRNLKCSVTEFCHKFKVFRCDKEGHLISIRLHKRGPFDHLNLLMIPKTVAKLTLDRCGLTSISAWSDLKGKLLQSMKIIEPETSNFKLNLDGLRGTLDYLPLEYLTLGSWQVSEYFGLETLSLSDPALPEIGKWMRASTLDKVHLQGSSVRGPFPCRKAVFCS